MSAKSSTSKGTVSTGPSPWLAVPALVMFGVFALIPLVGVFVLSFMEWDGLGTPIWNGVSNWREAFADPVTINAIFLTIKLSILTWLIQTPVSLLLGVFMAGKQRYRAVLSAIYFVPMLFSAAAVGIAFKALLDPNFGLPKAFSWAFLRQDWLGNPDLAFYVVLFVITWSFVPFHSLLYQAGTRQIPASLYEAASIDGAGRFKQFIHITLPQLKYTIVTSSTLMIVGSLTYFDLIFVMTNGGPGNATRILPLHMYLEGFRSYNMGVAAVVGVILVVVGVTISLMLSRFSGASKMESQMSGA